MQIRVCSVLGPDCDFASVMGHLKIGCECGTSRLSRDLRSDRSISMRGVAYE